MRLESDKNGARFVATDGRRLVIVELDPPKRRFRGKVIIPTRGGRLAIKLIDKKTPGDVQVFVQENRGPDGEEAPSDLFVAGPDWILSFKALEGHFPVYRDVVPESHSQFVIDRRELIETLAEVTVSTNEEAKTVHLALGPESVSLAAESPEVGESRATIHASFAGGGDSHIMTGFNPRFLLDALKNLPGEQVVINVEQNVPDKTSHNVRGRPALLYGLDQPQVRWVVMPLNLDLEASPETLGSNFENGEQPDTSRALGTSSKPQTASSRKPTTRAGSTRRRAIQHEWPDVGTTLEASYEGRTYTAVVINAPHLKSGRALQVTSGPVAGHTFNSMTAAMVAATAHQRQELGLGTSKKGLPSSGWDFWAPVRKQRASA